MLVCGTIEDSKVTSKVNQTGSDLNAPLLRDGQKADKISLSRFIQMASSSVVAFTHGHLLTRLIASWTVTGGILCCYSITFKKQTNDVSIKSLAAVN